MHFEESYSIKSYKPSNWTKKVTRFWMLLIYSSHYMPKSINCWQSICIFNYHSHMCNEQEFKSFLLYLVELCIQTANSFARPESIFAHTISLCNLCNQLNIIHMFHNKFRAHKSIYLYQLQQIVETNFEDV